MKIQDRINELFTKHLEGRCSPIEWEELLALVSGIEDEETLTEPLYRLWEQARNRELPSTAYLVDKDRLYASIVGSEGAQSADRPGRVRRIGRWLAAASVAACLLVAGGIWYLNRQSGGTPPSPASPFALVQPGTNKAVLVLAGGQQVVLDSAHSGNIGQQGGATIINTGGRLAYETGKSSASIVYNTVSTGRANQYQLVLPDGSRVWLNAVSSIHFPTAFPGASRTVEIKGEAYLEVARDPSRPFHVKMGPQDIEVLGTAFNVNAYTDEPVIKTSLLEGAVRVSSAGKSHLLSPGQEARLTRDGDFQTGPGNVELAIAWKNGFFQFDKAPLPLVLRQIGRWYDLDIQYEGPVPDRIFKGKLERSLPLSGILHLLEAEDIHFQLNGKVLVVTQ